MAERSQVPPPQYGHAPTSSSASALGRTRVGTGVRRNLFQNQLARRPTASTTSSGETASTTRGIDFDSAAGLNIVVRDKNGDIEVFDPLPLLEDDNGAIDEREEAKRDRERLAENVRQLSVARGRGEDDELLDALRISLRAKVAALDEDNWMFEAEDPPRNK